MGWEAAMSAPMSAPGTRVEPFRPPEPYRRLFVIAEAVIGGNALLGTALLLTDTFTPDVSVLAPLGLHSWVLPGLWLFASVAVPSGWACRAALLRSAKAPEVVLVASAALLVELAVQLPFLGFDPLQVVMGVPALALAFVAVDARRRGWR